MIIFRPLLLLIVLLGTAFAQDPKQLVQQAVQTEIRANRNDQSHWLYYESDRKPDESVTQWVAETKEGDLTRVLKKNGTPLSEPDQRKQMDDFIANQDAQKKQRSDQQHDDQQASALLKLLPVAFVWSDGGAQGGNRTLHFKPDPGFNPPTREARVFAAMEGDMVINSAQHRIVSLKGQLVHDVKFGLGVLGDLKEGGTFDVERRRIGSTEWQITESHIHVKGHELLFKSISEQEDDVKSRFRPLPSNLSLKDAEALLIKQSQ